MLTSPRLTMCTNWTIQLVCLSLITTQMVHAHTHMRLVQELAHHKARAYTLAGPMDGGACIGIYRQEPCDVQVPAVYVTSHNYLCANNAVWHLTSTSTAVNILREHDSKVIHITHTDLRPDIMWGDDVEKTLVALTVCFETPYSHQHASRC